jgi:hypothetical protein
MKIIKLKAKSQSNVGGATSRFNTANIVPTTKYMNTTGDENRQKVKI